MSSGMGDVPGTKGNPWVLKTTDGTTQFKAFRDPRLDPPAIVVKAEGKELLFHLRCLNDLDEMLKDRKGWMRLGETAEGRPAAKDTVEAWARSDSNPVKGWYGMTSGLRGRFAAYIPPIMVALDLAEIADNDGHLSMRTK